MEMKARDDQAEAYDRMWWLNLFSLVEVPAMLWHLSLRATDTLLEAGCGTGRMTRQFAEKCESLVAMDYSWESLLACQRKLGSAGVSNVDLVQADICRLPFRSASFERVVSCQVLEHVPTPESRSAAIEQLARVTKEDGNVALSAYKYSMLMRLFGEKEGHHEGGIYFFRFTRPELVHLLSRHLHVESVTGALVYHYIARCRKEEA
jgi:ubiquinone/menaquinone biosynthesis C-methylase UbiE